MKIKRVNRYYCEHCKKGGQSKYWINRHEQACTLSMTRICRLCAHPVDIQATIKAVFDNERPEPSPTFPEDYIPVSKAWKQESIEKLREICGHCPGCILAVLRQSGWAHEFFDEFKYKDEVSAWWREKNNEQLERESHYC